MELTQKQINNIAICFQQIVDIIIEVWKKIKELFIKFINFICTKKIKRINKYASIYMKTHNKRIKKKQLTKIYAILME